MTLSLTLSNHPGADQIDLHFYTARPTMKAILERCARDAGLTIDEVRHPRSRRFPICDVRQRFMYEAAMDGRWSWFQIANAAGRKDHSTALHGARAYAKRHGLPAPEARV